MNQSVVDFLLFKDHITILLYVFFSLDYVCFYFFHSFSSWQLSLRLYHLYIIALMLFLLFIFFIFSLSETETHIFNLF